MSLDYFNLEMDSGIMNLVVLTVALPLLTAFLLPVIARFSMSLARFTGPLVLLVSLLVTFFVWGEMQQPYSLALGGFRPPMGIVFYLDNVAMLFTVLTLLLAFLLWPVRRLNLRQVSDLSTEKREQNDRAIRTASLTLLLVAAGCGLALSGDLFNLYVFYELASVASFGLVAAGNSRAVSIATVRYVILSGLGTVMALTGIALVYTQTGTLNLAHLAHLAPTQLNNPLGVIAFVLILLGVGVKGELFPVNSWVPEVYATASKRVSALLAGLLSKLAVLVVVRLLVLVFQTEAALLVMLLLGLLGVISAELAAWRAKDMSRMLAYSSIGQLGIVFVAFSIPGEAGVFAGLAVALHHLIVKPALFLLASRWPGALQQLQGCAYGSAGSAGLTAALFVLLALSLIGVPPLPGFWAKLLVVTGLLSQPHALYLLALAVILLATVLEANYFVRVMMNLYRKESTQTEKTVAVTSQSVTHRMGMDRNLAVAGLMGVVLLASVLFVAPIGHFLSDSARQMTDVGLYKNTVFSEKTAINVDKLQRNTANSGLTLWDECLQKEPSLNSQSITKVDCCDYPMEPANLALNGADQP